MKTTLRLACFVLQVTVATRCAFSATPDSIVVSPQNATVAVGATQAFTAIFSAANGAVVTPAPVLAWTVSGGGTIDSKGVFSASTVGGPFTVTATAVSASTASKALVGTATVTVTSGAGRVLTSISIAPANCKRARRGAQQFVPTAKDQYGNPLYLPIIYTWSVSGGGTIDTFGLFTATTAGGPFTVSASFENIAGTATVTVVSTTPPPPILTKVLVFSRHDTTVPISAVVPYQAVGVDQNGVPVAPQPTFTWTVMAAGTINADGAFAANDDGRAFYGQSQRCFVRGESGRDQRHRDRHGNAFAIFKPACRRPE